MTMKLDPALGRELLAIYEEMMWLANRRNVTASDARSWFTHVRAEKVKRRLRRFTGKVSKLAAEDESATLRLEHYKRIQTKLTNLVKRQRALKKPNPDEFIRVVLDCERVHIVTFEENYSARRANGNYRKAGIKLLPWHFLSLGRQAVLWKTMLRGKVANAGKYAPTLKTRP
jgi:hypothetical protein